MKFFIFFILLMVVNVNNASAGQLIATVNTNKININETVILTLSYDQQTDQNKLDYSALNRDFLILSVRPSSSSQFQIINGRSTQKVNVTWRFELSPKRSGNLLIPAMQINADRSNSIIIAVSDNQVNRNPVQPVTAEIIVNQTNVKIEQEVVVTFRFGFIEGATPNGFNFNIKNSGLQPITLGQNNFAQVRNGIRVNYVDVMYAIYPEKVGSVTIGRQLITANYNRRRFTAQTQPITLKVSDAIQNTSFPRAQWFPAKDVKVRVEWSNDSPEIEVGEPVTASIILEATGQRSTLLPNVTFDAVEGVSYYSDQPKLEQKTLKSGIQATRIRSVAIIAKKEGIITIPKLTIPWWNSVNQTWQYATIEKRQLTVKPASNLGGLPHSFQESALAIDLKNIEGQKQSMQTLNQWRWLSLSALGLLMLSTLANIWFIYQYRKTKQQNKQKQSEAKLQLTSKERAAWNQLYKAIKNQNQATFKNYLVQWVCIRYQRENIKTIEDFLSHYPVTTVAKQLRNINENLYNSATLAIDWDNLLLELTQLRTKTKSKKQNQVVPDLYPT